MIVLDNPMRSDLENLPTSAEIKQLLQPYVNRNIQASGIFEQLRVYLELLLRWNTRINLTSIRDPKEIIKRHFGESIFAAQQIKGCESLLDFGSGAGFPGIPIQLVHPLTRVTLAESQNKKATFLREVVRALDINPEVWAARAEAMPAERRFEIVTMRAVDNMKAAMATAAEKSAKRLVILSTTGKKPQMPAGFLLEGESKIPETNEGLLILYSRVASS